MKPYHISSSSPSPVFAIRPEAINAQASRVLARAPWWAQAPVDTLPRTNEQFDPARIDWINKCLATPLNERILPRDMPNRAGERIGRFEIVMYSHRGAPINTSNLRKGYYQFWIVRCACGRHEMRDHRRLNELKRQPKWAMCVVCAHQERKRAA